MMWTMKDVEEGMFVTSTDGRRIGKVIRCDTETFVVEKGTLFPKDYELRYEYVKDIRDGKIDYMLSEDLASSGKQDLAESGSTAGSKVKGVAAKVAGLPAAVGAAAARAKGREPDTSLREEEEAEATGRQTFASREAERSARSAEVTAHEADTSDELRIPLMKEEIDVEKFQRDSGHVRIHKAVRVEEKHFSVPLRREELVIEHIAATGQEGAYSAAGAFEDQTMDIALQEEDIRVGKHSVLREEVVVRKVSRAVEKDAAASLRTEDLEIEDTRQRPRGSGQPVASASSSDVDEYNAPTFRH
jgi:uncharacterized protein (TIGR02271 family)